MKNLFATILAYGLLAAAIAPFWALIIIPAYIAIGTVLAGSWAIYGAIFAIRRLASHVRSPMQARIPDASGDALNSS